MIDTESILFRLTGDVVIVCDSETVIRTVNPAAEKCLKRPASDMIGKKLLSLVHSFGHAQTLGKLLNSESSVEQGFPIDFTLPESGILILKCSLEFDRSKRQILLVGTTYSPMNHEDHLRWRLALESTDAGFWGYNLNANLMYFSTRFEQMLGYEPGDLPPNWQNLLDTVYPDDREMVSEHANLFRSLPNYSYRYECRLLKKDGSPLWVLAMGTRHQDSAGNDLGNGWRIDIHDRKMMELKLLSSERKSRTLLEALPDIIFVLDREGRYLEVHANAAESLMFPRDQLIGRKITEVMPNELGQRSYAGISAAIERGETSSFEYELDLPRGLGFFEARFSPYEMNSALVVIRDITESRLAQIAMRESDERLRDFIDNCPAVVYNMRISDEGSFYTFVGGRAEEVFETSASELMGRSMLDTTAPFIHPEDVGDAQEALNRALSTMSGAQWTGRYVLPSGKIRWINSIGKPRRNDDGTLTFSAISMDVTHERMLAQKVREQQALMSSSTRLAALGEMAGGIAHEINNPLTVAHAHASRLRNLATSGKPVDRETITLATEKIEAVCMRISRIIAGLRSIARDGEHDRFSVSPIGPIVNDALSLVSEKLRNRQIDFRVEMGPQSLSIECRSVQISQIIVNLLLNAQYAVEAVRVTPGTERWIALNIVEADANIEVRISNSGLPIPPDIREKIFDPFFTTKEVGKGTGLGLSVSASIARAHDGLLFLDQSAPQTTFVLRLPKRQNKN